MKAKNFEEKGSMKKGFSIFMVRAGKVPDEEGI
jgi:hypothetical protein